MGCSPSIHHHHPTPVIHSKNHVYGSHVTAAIFDVDHPVLAEEIPIQVSVLLNQKEKTCIRESWSVLDADAELHGKQIFLRIFEEAPPIKDLFPFRCAWGDKLLQHPAFREHAARFMRILEEGVANLDHLDSRFTPTMLALGASHVRHTGFRSEYFKYFRSAILFILRTKMRDDFTPEVRTAWEVFLSYLLQNLQEGYNEARRTATAPMPSGCGYLVHSDTI